MTTSNANLVLFLSNFKPSFMKPVRIYDHQKMVTIIKFNFAKESPKSALNLKKYTKTVINLTLSTSISIELFRFYGFSVPITKEVFTKRVLDYKF